ncbi:MAG TPA: hypothetical protein VL147_11195 [Devosia sp.]|nr:hypothetical protein [Devosia sp.]
MNAFANENPSAAAPESELLLDWKVDIERISGLAREAFRTETPDPWTRIEAECVIQLIDAELIAMRTMQSRGEPVDASIRYLKALRTEAVLAIKTLDAVERHGQENAAPSAGHSTGTARASGRVNTAPDEELAA